MILKQSAWGEHLLRGIMVRLGTFLWVVGFANNLFFIDLAYLFLKENVSLKSWACTVISFLSLLFIVDINELSWVSGTVVLLGASFFFALSIKICFVRNLQLQCCFMQTYLPL
ncbi:MAG: hypothetical protein LBD32_00020 [Cytophagales bacterium]|jgi:drug/metabolite transporter (DMT)-like permease|nr:hypothetical protein [Cytophagales bacterium]